jgi:YYY domain-containing protein
MDRSAPSEKTSRTRAFIIPLALIAILLIGGAFRLYNVNWDKGTYHIHPDERNTAMVITAIQWPHSLLEYFDTSHSPLNARNVDMVYFYGTLPLFLTKYVGTLLGRTGYDEIHLVGRVLSALFDLGTILLLFFLARRLFDWRVGLVSSFLLALTVLNIQGSHYFAVDTFLTFFVALTLWFTLDVAQGKGWPAFVGLGISMGLTMACKVSVFLLVAVVALGGWIRLRRRVVAGARAGDAALRTLAGLALAALAAFAIFRVAQPYAWAGPNYDGWDSVPEPWGERLKVFQRVPEPIRAVLMPNPQWIADIISAGAQQTGEADMPWGRQWTERTPWLFPLQNMVVWGMGVPLGVAAWLGVVLIVVQLILAWRRSRNRQLGSEPPRMANWDLIIIPLAWVLLTFVWQGMQFVKSVRYFLPIFPYLAMFAAYLVVSAWDWASARRWNKLRKWGMKAAAGGLAALVLLGTLAWAFAFIQIYREPVTRVQATRWMYENIDSGATLHYQSAGSEAAAGQAPGKLQVPLPSTYTYATDGEWLITPFIPPQDLIATEVTMNNLTGLNGPSEGAFEVKITSDQPEEGALAQAQIQATFGGEGGKQYVLDIPDTDLREGETYYLQTRAVRGAPLVSMGSAIANEHFDDPLPFSMDGRIAFGSGPYRGLDLTLYDEDTPEKLESLLDTLDETDYISMSSGRLWQSIPRLPMRYPVTTRYYELLFAGKLGFEKVAEFHSYPRLFGVEFNDTYAEEQFTVYDHPKVLIYRKTDEYNRELARAMLTEGVDWDNIPHWLNPRDVPQWRRDQARQQQEQQSIQTDKNSLMLTDAQRQMQEQGGTWASIFDRNSLTNRWPTLSWLVLMALLGMAALPLTVAVFRWLPDRGYILARPVGVLLLGWLSWMLTNLTALHYDRGTIALALVLITVVSYSSFLLRSQRQRFLELWRTQKGLILVNELLFLAFFALFWFIRWGNPDLWHPWKGGEKPMDFAYLNAVIKSVEFPPYDPWFAGGYLNYYYFGQVMVGSLIKLIGIVPNVAYNLTIPTWFAMTAMAAFSVTFNLIKGNEGNRGTEEGSAHPSGSRRALLFGLLGALFVAVLGNLGEIHLLLLKVGQGVVQNFQSTIPGLAGLVRTVIGSAEVVFGGRALPIGLDEWYWNASRAIPAGPSESVITEFPFFTFLYADLHAHLIAMPLTFVSLAAALAMVRAGQGSERKGWRELVGILGLLLLWALAIGAMRTTNTWDVPPHLLLVLGALAIAEYSRLPVVEGRRRRFGWRGVWAVAWKFGLVCALSWLVLYWPFWENYGSFYNSVAVWTGTRTPLWAYLVVHGLFLFAIVSYLTARVFGRSRHLRPDPWYHRLRLTLRYWAKRDRLQEAAQLAGVRELPLGPLFWLVVVVFVLVEVFLLVPGLIPFTHASLEALAAGGYACRGLSVLALGLPIAVLGLLLLFRPGLSPTERLWSYLVLLGLAMSLGVEVLVLQGDIGRMNTVFKFYLQVWLMWGVCAAAALAWMVPRLRRWRQGRGLWVGTLVVLVLFAALYPPLATSAKVRDRFDTGLGPGLDGWEYMTTSRYYDVNGQQYDLKWDLEAMRWLLDNVVGSPVILEGHTPEYRWGARYSSNTGLPTVLGWNWHQRQQRAAADDQEVWTRADEIARMYNDPIPALMEPLLDKYHVRYIIVGPLERAYYEPTGLMKFEQMVDEGTLRVAFRNEGVTIYEVVQDR